MDLIKKHVDTVIILGGILSSVFWMNHKFTEVDNKFGAIDLRFVELEKDISLMKSAIDLRFAELEKDMAIMKAVLMVKGQFPKELMATAEEK